LPVVPVYNHCTVNNLRFRSQHGMEEVIDSILIAVETLVSEKGTFSDARPSRMPQPGHGRSPTSLLTETLVGQPPAYPSQLTEKCNELQPQAGRRVLTENLPNPDVLAQGRLGLVPGLFHNHKLVHSIHGSLGRVA